MQVKNILSLLAVGQLATASFATPAGGATATAILKSFKADIESSFGATCLPVQNFLYKGHKTGGTSGDGTNLGAETVSSDFFIQSYDSSGKLPLPAADSVYAFYAPNQDLVDIIFGANILRDASNKIIGANAYGVPFFDFDNAYLGLAGDDAKLDKTKYLAIITAQVGSCIRVISSSDDTQDIGNVGKCVAGVQLPKSCFAKTSSATADLIGITDTVTITSSFGLKGSGDNVAIGVQTGNPATIKKGINPYISATKSFTLNLDVYKQASGAVNGQLSTINADYTVSVNSDNSGTDTALTITQQIFAVEAGPQWGQDESGNHPITVAPKNNIVVPFRIISPNFAGTASAGLLNLLPNSFSADIISVTIAGTTYTTHTKNFGQSSEGLDLIQWPSHGTSASGNQDTVRYQKADTKAYATVFPSATGGSGTGLWIAVILCPTKNINNKPSIDKTYKANSGQTNCIDWSEYQQSELTTGSTPGGALTVTIPITVVVQFGSINGSKKRDNDSSSQLTSVKTNLQVTVPTSSTSSGPSIADNKANDASSGIDVVAGIVAGAAGLAMVL
ncbi:UNVERIFIED_CONTAM: hypothetical protein HDU68_006951 [Siphonaria sp. JEL0065]|nr:hypothetical protein HDU68_006951 [Siphonaria sp. JEL0065]